MNSFLPQWFSWRWRWVAVCRAWICQGRQGRRGETCTWLREIWDIAFGSTIAQRFPRWHQSYPRGMSLDMNVLCPIHNIMSVDPLLFDWLWREGLHVQQAFADLQTSEIYVGLPTEIGQSLRRFLINDWRAQKHHAVRKYADLGG